MRNLIILSLFVSLLSVSLPAEPVKIHAWKGRTYINIDGYDAEWNSKLGVFVISVDAMQALLGLHPTRNFYANGTGFFGQVAGGIGWHYRLVTTQEANDAITQNVMPEAFAPRWVGGTTGNIELIDDYLEVPELHVPSDDRENLRQDLLTYAAGLQLLIGYMSETLATSTLPR